MTCEEANKCDYHEILFIYLTEFAMNSKHNKENKFYAKAKAKSGSRHIPIPPWRLANPSFWLLFPL